ncbi:MAG: gliding motility-associated C-terminal domain-containing protein [Bacteroidetes bacterium]|nr:gliding motility-associated C-terminal domain-containing protein [Bacteroidota bacterium]
MSNSIKKQYCVAVLALIFLMSQNAFAAKWYVNDAFTAGDIYCSAIGNNGNPGTAAAPFLTVTHVISNKVLAAGDTVFIDAGDYTDNFMLNTNADGGSAVNQLVFKGAGTSLSKFVYTGGANAVYFGAGGAGNSYITFLDLYIETTANVSTFYVEQGSNSNIIVNNCSIKSAVSGGAVVLKGCNNSKILNTTISTIYDAIDAYSCSNNIYDGNTLTHRIPYVGGGNHLGMIVTGTASFGGAPISDNNIIRSNKISGFNYAFDMQEQGSGNTWMNNYVWDCEIGMFCSLGGVGNHNTNTFKFNSILTDKDCLYGACLNWTIQNNIFYTKGGAGSYCINLLDVANDPSTLDYNIYYTPTAGGQAARRFATTYDTAAWKNVLYAGSDANSRGWDPKFTSMVNLDLLAGSSAISAALSDVTVTDDVRRNPAIVRTAVNQEIGAFEIDCNSVGGTVTSDATVCSASNGGTINLSGHTGSVVKWQSSVDNFVTPVDIANVTTSLTYTNILVSTKYRAVVQDGACPSANSSSVTITVDPVSAGGTVTADATVCSGTNGANLTLAGNTGSIIGWESSTDNFVTSTPIVNGTNTQAYLNLTATTKFRAIVKSGACAAANSAAATITVDSLSVGGTVTSDAAVCSGNNSGTLHLAGYTGSITGWESSTDNFLTPNPIVNTTDSLVYTNLAVNTKFRAVITSGTCAAAYSVEASITIDPVSVGGTVTADATVCSGLNSGTLTLAGHTGSIVAWESSTNNFSTSNPIANTTINQAYNNITTTTKYRAIVKSGACASTIAVEATITVDPVSVGGTVTSDTSVCSGSNSGTLTLAGYTGTITGWESSENNFVSTTPIANVTSTLNYNNITNTTKYRAVVASGVCAASNSSAATIAVDPVSVGGTVNTSVTVCSGANAGTLTLSGNTGSVIGWESSTDNFLSSIPIINLTSSQSYNNLAVTTQYRAIVKSGSCGPGTSASATITIDPMSVGGIVSSNDTVCSGINSGKLLLTGFIGTITGWESSINNFGTSMPLANTTDSLIYSNLTATTKFRAIVVSGVCSSANSNQATINVDAVSVGGIVSNDSTICSGTNSGILTLSGKVGNITGWQSSSNNFISSTPIGNLTSSLNYNNLTSTTKFRAIVKSGVCPADSSAAATITVDPLSLGGSVTSDAMVCAGNNSGNLTLGGHFGIVQGWESSTNDFSTSAPISNATSSYSYKDITVTTKYRAIVKSGVCPADTSASATITIDPISVTINDKSICEGSTTTFDAGSGYSSHAWSGLGAGILQTTNAAVQGTYIVTVTDGLGCTAVDSAYLTVNAFPSPKLGGDTAMCQGQSITLNPQTANSLNYLWSNAAQTPTISVNTTGQYIVTVSDNIGCSRKDTIFVQVHTLPTVDLGLDKTICDNNYDKVTLTANYSGSKQLLWSTSETNVDSIIITQAGSYWVQITDSNKCSATDEIALTVHCEDFVLTWPDVITPNGDGINDIFKPKGVDDSNFPKVVANVRIISFGVYDRWGRFMFYSEENVLPNWDGKLNGSPAAPGTYYFVIKYQNSAGKAYEIASFMTLLD